MAQRFENHRVAADASAAPALSVPSNVAAAEARVRQLIANGKHKAALDSAKEAHKAHGTVASEALLIDAYAARIQSLIDASLVPEAKALLELARERYPAGRARFEVVGVSLVARTGTLDDLVRPLNDSNTRAECCAAIERAIRQEVHDLAALARCEVLPLDHPLRQGAGALQQAFCGVTSGPVSADALVLPEVSHRSPLASWKLLVRAIACFYREEDDSCRRYLDAIPSDAAPARLVPAMRAMLGERPTPALSAAAAALVSRTTANGAALQRALEALDRALAAEKAGAIWEAIRVAVQECRQSAPGQLERLKQHIAVRATVADLETAKLHEAMGGPVRHDAYFLRLCARGLETSGEAENLMLACGVWNQFRQEAAREGWFRPNSAEAATLYLHMAELLRKMPPELLRPAQHSARQRKAADEELHFLFPDELYERACALDPHAEAFAQWMDWAVRQSARSAERVAEAWHKILPCDMQPILYLMEATDRRGALHTALGYLGKAERIDNVHPAVRNARLRLLAGSALKHIQQKKPHLAEQELARMATLPQSQQGDRPAFLAALHYMASAVQGDSAQAAYYRAEIERLLGSGIAAALLVFAAAQAAKRPALEKLPPVEKLSSAERTALPAALARIVALAADMQMTKTQILWTYIVETAKQFPQASLALNVGQLRSLAEAGVCAKHFELAYAASGAGLERGGTTEARFMFLRAQSLPQGERRTVCAAAAAELARQQRDLELVEKAVELLRDRLRGDSFALTAEQTAEVVRREKTAASKVTSPGPSYRDFFADELCSCPDCRRARGETVDAYEDFADDEDEELDEIFRGGEPPPDMPPALLEVLIEETKKAVRNGESPEELISRLFGMESPGGRRKKGRRR